jgi:hypothetical protein
VTVSHKRRKKLDEPWPVFQRDISLWSAFRHVLSMSLFSGNTESGDNHKKKYKKIHKNLEKMVSNKLSEKCSQKL